MSTKRILGTWRNDHRRWLGEARWALFTALLLLPLACDVKDYGPGPLQSDEFMLSGTVLDTDSNPVPRARVWVFRDNESLPFGTTAEADGTYSVPFERGACNGTFEGGRFVAWVSCPDCAAELVRCPYSADGAPAPDIDVDVHARPGEYHWSGTVSEMYGPGLAGVEISLWPTGKLLATSGEDGTFLATLAPEDCLSPPGLEALNRVGFFGRYAKVTCDVCGGHTLEFQCGWGAELEGDLWAIPEGWPYWTDLPSSPK